MKLEASCLWADIAGHISTLGIIGAPRSANTISGSTKLDTSDSQGAGIFFGSVGSSVTISRKGAGSWALGRFNPNAIRDGAVRGDWADQQPYCVGWPSYAPKPSINFLSWSPIPLVAANAICTRVWLCDPRGLTGPNWQTACVGGQDARWSAWSKPAVNVYGDFGTAPINWSVKGWPQGAWSWNYVSLVSIMKVFPCDMVQDFFLPASSMSILPNSDGTVKLSWAGAWGCRPPGGRYFFR